MKKVIFIQVFFQTVTSFINSQTIIYPNFALKSHETLEIRKIETDKESTIIHLTIENRINGGSFCADRNIFIVYPDGNRVKMTSAQGIPTCPAVHRFKAAGEKLDFTISFPLLSAGTEWIDLIEECQEDCFSFYGITLDNILNKEIEDAFQKADNSDPETALAAFVKIIEKTDERNLGSEGLLFINIINLSIKAGDNEGAEVWYERFRSSGAPRLTQYLKFLNDQGVKF